MNFRINQLTVKCHQEKIVIDFMPNITIFHGPTSAGKSTIVRLIDYCLGREMPKKTRALQQELESTTLEATIGSNIVQFKRIEGQSNYVEVTWTDKTADSFRFIKAPVQPVKTPIMNYDIFSLSDLIFFLMGKSSIEVPKKVTMTDFKQLTFRNLMWYCYLEQELLASKFYHLLDPIIEVDSRNAMKYIMGQFTDNMQALLKKLSDLEKSIAENQSSIKSNSAFLEQFGFESSEVLANKINGIQQEIAISKRKLNDLHLGHLEDTHFTDRLRNDLRELSNKIESDEQDLLEIKRQIEIQKSLRSELLTAQNKLFKTKAAKKILYSVSFKTCPECGKEIKEDITLAPVPHCPLCKQDFDFENSIDESANISDIKSRIEELNESIELQQNSLPLREHVLEENKKKKIELDRQLNDELRNYDSSFLSNSRDLERKVAELNERLNNYNQIIELPKALIKANVSCKQLLEDKIIVKQEIDREKNLELKSKVYIQELEHRHLVSMVASEVPGVTIHDKIQIDANTWIPHIYEGGDANKGYTFYNAGSLGKATLINVCYALALHQVTSKHDLPLPSFLIIDTPMQHIHEGLNRKIFEAFYNNIYNLAKGPLCETQFIIIDKEYFPPQEQLPFEVKHQYLEKLIPYYNGA
jgi:DNA-binding protein YbaB